MKIQALLITAIASLAFAVAGANATILFQATGGGTVTHKKAVHHIVKKSKTSSKSQTKVSSSSKTAGSTPPLYIHIPVGPAPAVAPSAADDCATTGNDCTDQQLCDIWGENCGSTGQSAGSSVASQPVAPASVVQTSDAAVSSSGSSSDAAIGQSASGDTSDSGMSADDSNDDDC